MSCSPRIIAARPQKRALWPISAQVRSAPARSPRSKALAEPWRANAQGAGKGRRAALLRLRASVVAMKIFGNPGSTCTRKVLLTLNETHTPFEFSVVDFAKGEHKQPAHLAHQPFGQVPALEDNGFELYESRAMARYIDEKAGSPLTPKGAQARALMEQWISVETSNFTPHAMKFVYHAVFKREQTPEVLKTAEAGLEKAYAVL